MNTSGAVPTETDDINEGFVPIYVTPLNLKLKNAADEKELKEVVFKILVRQTDDVLESVRFQIANDKELDFLYESTYDEESFNAMKDRQHLEIDFSDFPNVVRQLVATIVKQDEAQIEDGEYKASFKDKDEPQSDESGEEANEEEEAAGGQGRRCFFIVYQRLEFCRVQIFKLVFTEAERERVQRISQARYDEVASKLKAVETEYKDIYKRIQRQAPKILADFKLQEK